MNNFPRRLGVLVTSLSFGVLIIICLQLDYITYGRTTVNVVKAKITTSRSVFPENKTHHQAGYRTTVNKTSKGIATKGTQDCYSQCCEELRIYERYFANPTLYNGIYVEIGAFDGIEMSNTKFFEDNFGWTGLLVEGNPVLFKQLKKNRPRSITVHSAVCREGVKKVNFTQQPEATGGDTAYISKLQIHRYSINVKKTIEVACKPMGKLLRDAGISSIDFFSLDVEGAELLVLQTMDWTIPVKVFLVETYWSDKKVLTEYLKGKGYRPVTRRDGCYVNTVFEYNKIS